MWQAPSVSLDYKSFWPKPARRMAGSLPARMRPLRQSRFPWSRRSSSSDFDFQPSLDRRQVRELAGSASSNAPTMSWSSVPPGVGKTHLAVALGVKAVESRHSVLFHTLESS